MYIQFIEFRPVPSENIDFRLLWIPFYGIQVMKI